MNGLGWFLLGWAANAKEDDFVVVPQWKITKAELEAAHDAMSKGGDDE